MKRLLLSTLFMFFLFSSCNSDDAANNEISCSEASLNVATALTNFDDNGDEEDNYESLCNAYKTALTQQKSACGDPAGAIQLIIIGLGDCEIQDAPD